MKQLMIAGVVLDANVIPRTVERDDEVIHRDYVLLVVETINGDTFKGVANDNYIRTMLTKYGVEVPEVDTTSEPILDLIGQAVKVGYEESVKGKTTYVDDDGEVRYHKSSGNNIREIFVMPKNSMAALAYQNAILHSQGISEFAMQTAASQSVAIIDNGAQALASARERLKAAMKPTEKVVKKKSEDEPPVDEPPVIENAEPVNEDDKKLPF